MRTWCWHHWRGHAHVSRRRSPAGLAGHSGSARRWQRSDRCPDCLSQRFARTRTHVRQRAKHNAGPKPTHGQDERQSVAGIHLEGIHKIYPNGTHAVHDVDLHIADGEFLIMVGPSGCAKSTILRMIAGLETPTAGPIEIGGVDVNDVPRQGSRHRDGLPELCAVPAHDALRENMAFGLKLRRMPEGEIDQRVTEAARILGPRELLERLPKRCRGGQRQRVAMGRAIVREPQAFLMDEPLSNLDAKLRVQMRTEIAKLHQRLRHDDGLRDPRSGRGHDARSAHLHPATRARAAGRHACDGLHQPGEHVRRRASSAARA